MLRKVFVLQILEIYNVERHQMDFQQNSVGPYVFAFLSAEEREEV